MCASETYLVTALLVVAAAAAQPATIRDEDPAFDLSFPPAFVFSSATASYQVEGAWNVSGKGENVWDRTTHEHPEYVLDGSNGDVACDSYHKYKEDIKAAKAMGTKMYRFSLSWSRLLPRGSLELKNEDGVRYYNAVIDECIANGIEPMVTLFHWDLPQPLQDLGGFPNEVIADYFEDYADYAFQTFGDKVKWWVTINEPMTMCVEGYGNGKEAPAVLAEGRGDYLCGHTMLKAHARTYHLYDRKYRDTHQGMVGMSANSPCFWPKDANNTEDIAAADRWQQFQLGWFLHPILSEGGDYPEVMKQYVLAASMREGLQRSRLPLFTEEEIDMIRGSVDFVGMNLYTSGLVTQASPATNSSNSQLLRVNDAGVVVSTDPSWEATAAPWHFVVPEGMRKLLNWIRTEYDNPRLIITENGYPDLGGLRDEGRVRYYRLYLLELLKAIHYDGCNIFGYTAWSLVDNYEWFYGYVHKFGLHHVDFSDPERPRTPKMSAEFFKRVIATNKVPRDGDIDFPADTTSPSGGSPTAAGLRSSVLFSCSLVLVAARLW